VNVETVQVGCAGLDDGELYGLRMMILWLAAELDIRAAQRHFLLHLGDQLRDLGAAREFAFWRLEADLLDPGGPVRDWYPPTHRQPDEPAYGL
jgi:hypothetical protein